MCEEDTIRSLDLACHHRLQRYGLRRLQCVCFHTDMDETILEISPSFQTIPTTAMGNSQSLEDDQSVRIANLTELPLVYVISQIGPLYWGVIQPGQRVTRCTGRVWFTIDCFPYNGENEPQTKDAVIATLVPTLLGLGVVAISGGAFMGAAAAAAPLAGTAQAALAPLLPVTAAPGVVGTVAAGSAGYQAFEWSAKIHGLVVKKEHVEESTKSAKKTGHYANGDWLHVHGGPKKGVNSEEWKRLHFVT
jgi:hypothetical protein